MLNKDDVIRLAKDCSFTPHWEFEKCLVCNPDSLFHFAKLVAEHEREECALLCEQERLNAQHYLATTQSNWLAIKIRTK